MKMMYCWRCGSTVPMLDEDEFAKVEVLLARAVKSIKAEARMQNRSGLADFMEQQYRPFLDAYRQITGEDLMFEPLHVFHHRISKYGPPCQKCGKPLRTPRARHCAACGQSIAI